MKDFIIALYAKSNDVPNLAAELAARFEELDDAQVKSRVQALRARQHRIGVPPITREIIIKMFENLPDGKLRGAILESILTME